MIPVQPGSRSDGNAWPVTLGTEARPNRPIAAAGSCAPAASFAAISRPTDAAVRWAIRSPVWPIRFASPRFRRCGAALSTPLESARRAGAFGRVGGRRIDGNGVTYGSCGSDRADRAGLVGYIIDESWGPVLTHGQSPCAGGTSRGVGQVLRGRARVVAHRVSVVFPSSL